MDLYWSLVAPAALLFGFPAPVPPSSALASAPGACALVTRQEAAEAWGADVPAGVEQAMPVPVPGGRTVTTDFCVYGSAVTVSRTPLGTDAKHLFALLRQDNQATKGDDLVNVTGMGDEAFYGLGKLTIRKGNTLLELGIAQDGIRAKRAGHGEASRRAGTESALKDAGSVTTA